MISVEKAKKLIEKHVVSLSDSEVKCSDALGRVVWQDIVSPIDLPSFHQSAMDGYALLFSDVIENKKIKIIGEIAAGKDFRKKIISGQAVRIFTGAPVPEGADTVIMQEKVISENGYIIINDPLLKQGMNIRKAGTQIKKGFVALPAKTIITPAGVGYLTAMGITKAKVYSQPAITVVVTGSELKKPGTILKSGQIYESNSYALVACLKSIGLNPKNIFTIKDEDNGVKQTIEKAMKNSDVVIITGGISVGDYDFTGKSLSELDVETVFYKVTQKPGKPLFFGKYKDKIIFALPGNPAAVLSCFYEYVYPALRIQQGHTGIFMQQLIIPMAKEFSKKLGLSSFLKGKISGNTVLPLEGQESNILSSFAIADCLIYLPADKETIKKGELVEVHKLPGIY